MNNCPLHNEILVPEDVPVDYGLAIPDPEYAAAHKKLFPHAAIGPLGGCNIDEDSPRTSTVMVCPQCEDARRLWAKQHKRR